MAPKRWSNARRESAPDQSERGRCATTQVASFEIVFKANITRKGSWMIFVSPPPFYVCGLVR